MTPVNPPQPAAPFGPVDQLMTPTMHGAARLVLEHRAAGIAGAGANSVANTVGYGIDQADLQRAGLARGNEAGNANGAAALAVAAHGDADAGDGEAAADLDRNIRHADRHRAIFP